ncbi:hypothetical protein NYR58_17890, partial [Chelativorans intermedius]|nr:hypothetical protein [Chelativorans intermedius]
SDAARAGATTIIALTIKLDPSVGADQGQFGAIEMGSMFSVVKVREGLSATDYSDPGWYEHPEGTVAYEWTGNVPAPVKSGDAKTMTPASPHGGHGKQG